MLKKKLIEKYANVIDDAVLKDRIISIISGKEVPINEDENYATQLAHKLWWKTIPDAQLEKVAIKPENFPNSYWGKAQEREGNAGYAMMRYNPLKNDKEGRYAIAIGEYFYEKEPPSTDREVAIKLNNKWVLANVNSLKRLGFSSADEIRNLHERKDLQKQIDSRLNIIGQISDVFTKLRDLEDKPTKTKVERMNVVLKSFLELDDNDIENYPDDEVKTLIGQFHSEFKQKGFSKEVLATDIIDKLSELGAIVRPISLE